MSAVIAWLWQNGSPLAAGCFQFYPSEERAAAEIAYCGGWKTPVFVSDADDALGVPKLDPSYVFDGLDSFEPKHGLFVSEVRAAAILTYMRAEGTGEYQIGHPGRRETANA